LKPLGLLLPMFRLKIEHWWSIFKIFKILSDQNVVSRASGKDILIM